MSSDDPLSNYQKDWERRKAISQRFGNPCLVAAAFALILYLWGESVLPTSPQSATGQIFPILRIGRGRGPLFVYGAQWEQWLAIGGAGLGLVSFIVGAMIYFRYNPNAFNRGVKSQMRD